MAWLRPLLTAILTPVLEWLGGLILKIINRLVEAWKSKKRIEEADKEAEAKAQANKDQMAKAETDDEFDKAARDSVR